MRAALCHWLGAGEPVGQRRGCVATIKGFMWVSRFHNRSDSSEPNSMCTFSSGLWMAGSGATASQASAYPGEDLLQLMHTGWWQSRGSWQRPFTDPACPVLPRAQHCLESKCRQTASRRAARELSQRGTTGEQAPPCWGSHLNVARPIPCLPIEILMLKEI